MARDPLPPGTVSVWTRAVADPAFRDRLIEDPLRALAGAEGVHATPEEARRLEGMDRAERTALIAELVRRVTAQRARDQWGDRFWSPDVDTGPGDLSGPRDG
ncbi:MAG: Os1348 family NHLP clan protein [Thermoleophilia bacterium]|jgi:hypothetical protein|nr:Os1348 family NHLP clan protein [Thermoleophilia bacterium]